MIAGRQGLGQGVEGGETRCEAEAMRSAFQRCQTAFERSSRQIMTARVLEATILAQRLLRIRGGLVDRHRDRPGGEIRLLAGMDRTGAEAGLVPQRGASAHHSPPATNWSMSKRVRMPITAPLSRTSTAGLRAPSRRV